MPPSEPSSEELSEIEDEIETVQDAVIDNVIEIQREALPTMENAGTVLFQGVSQVQQEIAQFVVTDRIRHDFETQQEILRCHTLDDLRDAQMQFVETAMDQYSAEATIVMKLGSKVMARAMERGPI